MLKEIMLYKYLDGYVHHYMPLKESMQTHIKMKYQMSQIYMPKVRWLNTSGQASQCC